MFCRAVCLISILILTSLNFAFCQTDMFFATDINVSVLKAPVQVSKAQKLIELVKNIKLDPKTVRSLIFDEFKKIWLSLNNNVRNVIIAALVVVSAYLTYKFVILNGLAYKMLVISCEFLDKIAELLVEKLSITQQII